MLPEILGFLDASEAEPQRTVRNFQGSYDGIEMSNDGGV
jgi:hypothetical protein